MRRSLLLALLVLAFPTASAQEATPDPTDPARYFPLEVGNEWVWIVSGVHYEDGPLPEGQAVLEIVADTSVEGISYVEALSQEVSVSVAGDTTRVSGRFLMRFDAETATVRVRQGDLEEAWGETWCGLDAPYSPEGSGSLDGETCPNSDAAVVVSGGAASEFRVGDNRYTGQVKHFDHFWYLHARYVAGVGEVYYKAGDVGYMARSLQYARVGGIEYGDRTGLQTEAPLPRPRVTSIRRAFPNPFSDAFTIAVDHPRSGRVRVEVFDVLGRRVYHAEPVVPFGRTELRIALPPGAPGVYTARVQSARDRWPARPVRLVRTQ